MTGKLMLEIVTVTLGFSGRNPAMEISLETWNSNDWVQIGIYWVEVHMTEYKSGILSKGETHRIYVLKSQTL